MVGFLFARLDPPDSSAGEYDAPRSGGRRRAAAWDSDAHDRALATQVQCSPTDEARVAFDALYTAYRISLWRLARQFTQSDDAAHDVVQDVFVAIWVRRETWEVTGAVRAYLYGAVRNRAVSLLRAGARRADLLPESPAFVTDSSADLSTDLEELESALRKAIDALPERQRTALLLFWHESMNMSEIARVLGITPAASRKLLLSAQASLRRAVAKYL